LLDYSDAQGVIPEQNWNFTPSPGFQYAAGDITSIAINLFGCNNK